MRFWKSTGGNEDMSLPLLRHRLLLKACPCSVVNAPLQEREQFVSCISIMQMTSLAPMRIAASQGDCSKARHLRLQQMYSHTSMNAVAWQPSDAVEQQDQNRGWVKHSILSPVSF